MMGEKCSLLETKAKHTDGSTATHTYFNLILCDHLPFHTYIHLNSFAYFHYILCFSLNTFGLYGRLNKFPPTWGTGCGYSVNLIQTTQLPPTLLPYSTQRNTAQSRAMLRCILRTSEGFGFRSGVAQRYKCTSIENNCRTKFIKLKCTYVYDKSRHFSAYFMHIPYVYVVGNEK